MKKKTKKILVIGLDAMIPEFLLKFSQEGILPCMTRLMKNGVFAEMLASVQAETPTNWTCIATGSHPGTHGINSFGFHIEGEPFTHVYNMKNNLFPIIANTNTVHCMNRLSKAEYIWQSAEKVGKKTILVNFPGGYPPNLREGIIVDGTGPFSSPICKMSGWDRFSSHPADKHEVSLQLIEARNWNNLPQSKLTPLETMIDISGMHEYYFDSHGWHMRNKVENIDQDANVLRYYIAVLAREEKTYDTIVMSKEKDFTKRVTSLKLNQMSDWLYEKFNPMLGQKIYANMIVQRQIKADVTGKFRFRLLELLPDGSFLKIDRTPIFNLVGWVYPENIADKLIDDLTLENGSYDDILLQGAVSKKSPLCQVYESVEDMAEGLIKTCRYLTKHYEWDLLFTQIHAPDGINHDELNGLCQDSPTYDPEKEEECWNKFRVTYKVLDKYVEEVISSCADEETTVVVLSDHGGIPTKKRVVLEVFLEKEGLIKYKLNEEGRLVIDLEKSQVVSGIDYVSHNIWVNLAGRDPSGIVKPSDYEKIREQIIDILYSIKDPDTGEHVIALALKREDAEIFGHYGDRAGDILYVYKEGYTNKFSNGITGIDPQDRPENGFEPVIEGPEYGRHHSYLPTTRYSGCSVRAMFLMSGPDVKKGYRRRSPIRTIDVAPTLAFLMGIPYPETVDGLVFGDALVL